MGAVPGPPSPKPGVLSQRPTQSWVLGCGKRSPALSPGRPPASLHVPPGTVTLGLCNSMGLPSRPAEEQRCPWPRGRRHRVRQAANDSALWAPSRMAWRRHDQSLSSALCPLFSSPARTFYQRLFGDCGLSAAPAHLRTSAWLMWPCWLSSCGWKH